MVNPYRGEVELTLNDQTLPMRLSLGSLAELEASLKEDSLLSLVERYEQGAFKTDDLTTLLFAGLQGAGWSGTIEELLSGHVAGGPVAAAKAVGELLRVTFDVAE